MDVGFIDSGWGFGIGNHWGNTLGDKQSGMVLINFMRTLARILADNSEEIAIGMAFAFAVFLLIWAMVV